MISEVTGVTECAISKISYNAREIIGCLYVGKNDSEKNLITNIRLKLASYEIPQVLIRCQELPKSPNGKLLRNEVKKILENSLNKNDFKLVKK